VALTNYLRLAIDREWPQMAAGKESHEVTQALDAVYAAALRLTDKGSRQPAIFVEMFKQLDAITQGEALSLCYSRVVCFQSATASDLSTCSPVCRS
jgi:hypothetical protein